VLQEPGALGRQRDSLLFQHGGAAGDHIRRCPVLVAACPLRPILATPAAVLAALGRLAGTGILMQGGAALERLAEVHVSLSTKTGTLTEGRPGIGRSSCP